MEGPTFIEPLPPFLPLHQEIILLFEAISDCVINFLLLLHVLLDMAADVLILQGEHDVVVECLLSDQAHLRSFLFGQQFCSSLV